MDDILGTHKSGGAPRWVRPQELQDDSAEIEASGLFEVVRVGRYDWETVYDADGYIELNRFSNRIAMEVWQTERL